MHTFKRVARVKVVLYRLRPGAWSTVNERTHRKGVVGTLIDQSTFPPRFTCHEDETGEVHFLEDEVVWNVLLDGYKEPNFDSRYIDNLDHLFCMAATAVRCALDELKDDKFVPIEFTAESYEQFYDALFDHFMTLSSNPVFLARWLEFKRLTLARLHQIC
jgi:hypothetical protein